MLPIRYHTILLQFYAVSPVSLYAPCRWIGFCKKKKKRHFNAFEQDLLHCERGCYIKGNISFHSHSEILKPNGQL